MSAWLVVLLSVLSILSIFALDATVGRWLAGKLAHTFARNPIAGEATGTKKHLLVYLPGTLADGVDSIAEVESTLRRHFHRVLRVSYGFWRFKPEYVAHRIAVHIQKPGDSYNSITVLGSSMGTPLGIELVRKLRATYGWSPKSINFIMVDAPPSSEYFAEPGRTTSRILRWVYAGPLASTIADLFLSKVAVPPRDENIEEGLDHEVVKSGALKRMAKFHFSAICDQQRFLSGRRIDWSPLQGISVMYLSCIRNNETVVQPDAALEVTRALSTVADWFVEVPVDSTHCGYAERPKTWQQAFGGAFDRMAERSLYR